jgi:drug/metabolite transporter (DMT)-like permease
LSIPAKRSQLVTDLLIDHTSSRRQVIAIWWLACLLWSAGWLFIKIGVTDVPPVTFAAARLAVAALVLVPIVALSGQWHSLSRSDLWPVAASGVLLLSVNYVLVFWGAQFLASSLTAVLQTMSPVFGLVLGVWLRTERFSWRRTLGIATSIAGVVIITRAQFRLGAGAGAGSLAIMLGALCAALAYVVVKAQPLRLAPLVLVTWQTLCALPPLLIAAYLVEGNPLAVQWTIRSIAALCYLGVVSSVLAFWLNYWLLRRVDATVVLASALVQPLIAAVLGGLLLGEQLEAAALVGGVCILSGAASILKRQPTVVLSAR